MKITNKTKNVARGLTGIFAGLLAFSVGATTVVNGYRSWVNGYLGLTDTDIVVGEVDPSVDLYNFRVLSKEETGYDLTTTKGMYEYQRASATKIAEEGIVLMKNEKGGQKALPLTDKTKPITLLGRAAYDHYYGGSMGSKAEQDAIVGHDITLAEGLTENGFKVNETVKGKYEKAISEMTEVNSKGQTVQVAKYTLSNGKLKLNDVTAEKAGLSVEDKGDSNTAIVVVGRNGGEQGYYLPGAAGKTEGQWNDDHDALGLSIDELATIKYAKDNFTKVIVIINATSAMDVPELFEKNGQYEADAVLMAGLPGTYGFRAVANILTGKANPSGRMVDTYAARSSRNAANQNLGVFKFANGPVEGGKSNSAYMPEAEGIYIGYRYYETRYYDIVMGQGNASAVHTGANQDTAKADAAEWTYADEVVASFGYGLSYTTFSETLKSVSVNASKKQVTAEITVKNTGTETGKHVVQLYVSAPWQAGQVEKSAIQLIGYEKTKDLKPNDEVTLTITGDFQYFASYDSNYAHDNVKGAYILDEGDYVFSIGNGAHDALNNVLAAKGKTTENKMDYNGVAAKASAKHISSTVITRSQSGELIENQLQDMELSNFEEEITELSRSDWNTTWPETYDSLKWTDDMTAGLSNHTYDVHETDNGGKAVVWGADTKYTFFGMKPDKGEWIEYDDPRLIALVQQVTLAEAIQCVTQGGGQDWDAIPSIQSPAIKTTDGPVGPDADRGTLNTDWNKANNEYDGDDNDPYGKMSNRMLPLVPVVGATFSHEMSALAGQVLAMNGLWSGVTEIWGPGANIHRTNYNARNHEYYSEDPVLTAQMVDDHAREGQKHGLVSCPKHFAFNDFEANRNGLAPFMSEQRARELDLRCFQLAFENGTALATMTAFNRAGAVFSSAHKGLISGILREEWDWKGYCVTDMVNPAHLMNPRDCIIVGTDSMLTSNASKQSAENGWAEFTVEGLAKDMDMQQAIQDSVHRALYVFINSNVTNGSAKTSKVVHYTQWYDKLLTAMVSTTAVLTALCAAGYIATKVLLIKNGNDTTEA